MQPVCNTRFHSPLLFSNPGARMLLKMQPVLPPDRVCFGQSSTRTTDLGEILKHRWVMDDEFDELLSTHIQTHGYHLGTPPSLLTRVWGERPKVYQKLDQLANALQIHAPESHEIQHLVQPLGLTVLSNQGDNATLYKLSDGQVDLAFKVYSGEGDDISGMAHFQFFTFMGAHGAKDTMKTFACSIPNRFADSEQAQWLLSESIRSEPPFTRDEWLARGHASLSKLANQHQVYVHGIYDRVNNVLVDPIYTRHAVDCEWTTSKEAVQKNLRDMVLSARMYLLKMGILDDSDC